MRRIFTTVAAVGLALSLTACGADKGAASSFTCSELKSRTDLTPEEGKEVMLDYLKQAGVDTSGFDASQKQSEPPAGAIEALEKLSKFCDDEANNNKPITDALKQPPSSPSPKK